MKKVIKFILQTVFIASIVLLSTRSFAQNKEVEVIHTKMESVQGKEVPVNFTISKVDRKKLESSIDYQEFIKSASEKNRNLEFKMYVDLSIMVGRVKSKLSDKGSFEVSENTSGLIYYDDKGLLNITFPFKAKNESGSVVEMKALKTGPYVNIL